MEVSSKPVKRIAFAPRENVLAISSSENTLELWDSKTLRKLSTLRSLSPGPFRFLSFSPDGSLLAATAQSKVLIWDVKTGQASATFSQHKEPVLALAWSPDGKTLATASEDQTIILWNVEARKIRLTLKGHHDIVPVVGFSPDGKNIISASVINDFPQGRLKAGEIKIWDASTGKVISTTRWKTQASLPTSMAISSDGKMVALGDWNGSIRFWHLDRLISR
jgi:WD40 repeat protein